MWRRSNAYFKLAVESFARPLDSVQGTRNDDDGSDSDRPEINDPRRAINRAMKRGRASVVAQTMRKEAARIRHASTHTHAVRSMDRATWLHLATRDYQCALRLHPYCVPARLNLAAALLAAGKLKAARRQLAAFEGIVDEDAAKIIDVRRSRARVCECVCVWVWVVGS